MLAEWRNALAASVATTPEDADEVAERATPDTPLPQSGLTPRALSALEPFRLKTVGDLAALDTSRLVGSPASSMPPSARSAGAPSSGARSSLTSCRRRPSPTESVNQADPFTAPEIAAQLLVEAAGSTRAQARRTAAAVLLGLEGDVEPFAVLADLASALGLGGQPQVSAALAAVRDAWAKSAQAAALLDTSSIGWSASLTASTAPPGPTRSSTRSRRRPPARRSVDLSLGWCAPRSTARKTRRRAPTRSRRSPADAVAVTTGFCSPHSAEVADAAGPLGVARRPSSSATQSQGGEFVVPRGRSVPAFASSGRADCRRSTTRD